MAESITITPVTLSLRPGGMSTHFRIINGDAASHIFQIRAYAWKQSDGKDDLKRSEQVIVSPPMGVLPPGAQQVVRLGLMRPTHGVEQTFRLIVDELPARAAAGTLGIALQASLPLFVEPGRVVKPSLEWLVRKRRDEVFLEARNVGARHTRVLSILTHGKSRKQFTIRLAGPTYLLAGAAMDWRLPASLGAVAGKEGLPLRVRTDAGVSTVQATLDRTE